MRSIKATNESLPKLTQPSKTINDMRKIIGIGETILDILFKNNQAATSVPGGSTFNSMISLGRVGVPSCFLSEFRVFSIQNSELKSCPEACPRQLFHHFSTCQSLQ